MTFAFARVKDERCLVAVPDTGSAAPAAGVDASTAQCNAEITTLAGVVTAIADNLTDSGAPSRRRDCHSADIPSPSL